MEIEAIRLFVVNMIVKNNFSKIIKANEQQLQIEGGRKTHVLYIQSKYRMWEKTWIDNVIKYSNSREMSYFNKVLYLENITKNCTIMDILALYI